MSPLTEVMHLSTELMQHLSSTSEGNDNFPSGPAGVPRLIQPIVLGNDSVPVF